MSETDKITNRLRNVQRMQYLVVFTVGFMACATIYNIIDGTSLFPSAVLLVFFSFQILNIESMKTLYRERLGRSDKTLNA